MIYHVENAEQFKELINKPSMVVDFYATWCGPCRMLSPVIEEIDREGLVKCDFAKVDVDELGAIAGQFGISSIPTLMIFKNGALKETMVGFRGKPQLVETINKVID